MTQVTQLQCDVCGKQVALDAGDDWWNVQVSRRGYSSAPPVMDQQLLQQAMQQAQLAGNIGLSMPTGLPGIEQPAPADGFGAPKSVDVCSQKCASDFVRDSTKTPKKTEAAAAE